jgi:hypothetical protein
MHLPPVCTVLLGALLLQGQELVEAVGPSPSGPEPEPQRVTATALTVASLDGTVSVSVDPDSGALSAVRSCVRQPCVSYALVAGESGATLAGTLTLQASAQRLPGGGVLASRLVCIHAADVPCSSKQALVQETFSPRKDSVGWSINVSSPVDPTDPTPLWTAPLLLNVRTPSLPPAAVRHACMHARCCSRTLLRVLAHINSLAPLHPGAFQVTFAEAGDKQFWAPWERGNGVIDPLLPSDGGWSWWNGEYLMGAEVVKASDRVIHEMAAILDPTHDAGVSFIPSPANPPAHPTWLRTHSTAKGGFPSWNRSILTEIYLCHACSCQEISRSETAGQGAAPAAARPQSAPARPASASAACSCGSATELRRTCSTQTSSHMWLAGGQRWAGLRSGTPRTGSRSARG